MKTFYITGVSGFVGGILMIFGILSFYALISSVVFLGKELFKRNDELVRKIAFDSMAMSFILITLLHLTQMIIRVVHFQKTGNDINLVVTPGRSIYLLGDTGLHLESYLVDLGIYAICLFVNRMRYRFRKAQTA